MRRREFITLLGGAATTWPLAARAQQAAIPVVGFLRDSTAAGSGFLVEGLRKGLAEAGFVEGRNLTIDFAWTEDQSERLSALAAELVGRRVPVIVSSALNATFAAKAATSTIPVVFAVNNDPVASGLVATLNRPGGNLTGVSYLSSELGAKRLGLMHELLPKVTDFAVLAHPTYPPSAPFISDVKAAARSLGPFRYGFWNISRCSDTSGCALSTRCFDHRIGAKPTRPKSIPILGYCNISPVNGTGICRRGLQHSRDQFSFERGTPCQHAKLVETTMTSRSR